MDGEHVNLIEPNTEDTFLLEVPTHHAQQPELASPEYNTSTNKDNATPKYPNTHTFPTRRNKGNRSDISLFRANVVLEVDNLLKEKAVTKYLDHYRWIISSILLAHYTDRRMGPDSYSRINLDMLRQVVNYRKASSFLQDLIQWGLIESNHIFSRKFSISTGYRLTEPFRTLKRSQVFLTDKKLLKKIQAIDKNKQKDINKMKGYKHVNYWLRELQIDPAAYDVAQEHEGHQQDCLTKSVEYVHNKQFFATIDQAGRFHHNLSNMSRELRPFLSIGGKKLLQVDIKNSQPLFFYASLVDSPKISKHEKDMMKYLVTSGEFYETFGATQEDRDSFKRKFFRDVFFSNDVGDLYKSKHLTAFREQFPNYFAVMLEMRRESTSALPLAMQRAEALLIYATVEQFHKENPNAPVVTIHDSLVTTEEFIDKAEKVLLNMFWDRYQLVPTLDIK